MFGIYGILKELYSLLREVYRDNIKELCYGVCSKIFYLLFGMFFGYYYGDSNFLEIVKKYRMNEKYKIGFFRFRRMFFMGLIL